MPGDSLWPRDAFVLHAYTVVILFAAHTIFYSLHVVFVLNYQQLRFRLWSQGSRRITFNSVFPVVLAPDWSLSRRVGESFQMPRSLRIIASSRFLVL